MAMEKEHECLKTLNEKWEMPVYKPLMINMENGELKTGVWMIKMYHLTGTGRQSQKDQAHVRIKYCPFCGEKIEDK